MSIKFRAWYEQDGYMLSGDELTVDEMHSSLNDYFKDPEYVFMEYTALKDENCRGNNELCQHDIVYCSGYGNGVVRKNYWGEWCVRFIDQMVPIHDLVMEQDLGKKIGNTHENFELLEWDYEISAEDIAKCENTKVTPNQLNTNERPKRGKV